MMFLRGFLNSKIIELENKDYTPEDRPAAADHYAHAPGGLCGKCGRPIEADQPARRRGEAGWVHDLCPADA